MSCDFPVNNYSDSSNCLITKELVIFTIQQKFNLEQAIFWNSKHVANYDLQISVKILGKIIPDDHEKYMQSKDRLSSEVKWFFCLN